VRAPAGLLAAWGPPLGSAAVALLVRTLRLERREDAVEALWRGGRPAIYVVWHSRILLLPYLYRGRRLKVLASASRDGELIARLVERCGLEAVRGSSSRGGAPALRALTRCLAEGWSVVVAPDGPRGPREVAKPGAVVLAAMSGAPLVPLAVGAAREWRLSSWDGFRVPRPFSRCVVCFGEPLPVERGRDGYRAGRQALQSALERVSRAADLAAAA
jgi:hypothetical protein